MRPSRVDEAALREVADALGVSETCARLLVARGVTGADSARAFASRKPCGDRSPWLLPDMRAAVARIERAVERGEIIAIYGDYDVDGVTAVCTTYLYLVSRGAHVGYYIPSRSGEGYGVNADAVKRLADRGVTLIITVDTGITAVAETEYARSLGVDMVITDHHECHGELPAALAVVNPHRPDSEYPFCELAGVGVALKLVCALAESDAERRGLDAAEASERVFEEYADLASLGTVADVMPLIDENRAIVARGAKSIAGEKRVGITALVRAAGGDRRRDVSATFIGFGLAPRINAAGRMENASLAVELLLCDDENEAQEIARGLCEINERRKAEESAAVEEATRMIDEAADISNGGAVVLASDTWKNGIVGIVASRITEKYGMPTVLITFDGANEDGVPRPGDVGRGSGRGVDGMNLVSALSECSGLLERYGGHEMAAGLSIRRENVDEFRQKLGDYVKSTFAGAASSVTVLVDAEIRPDALTLGFAREISDVMEPCGVGNETPVFMLRNAEIASIRGVGAGKHTKLTLSAGGKKFDAMYFGISPEETGFCAGDTADVIFTVDVNKYGGNEKLQLLISDMHASSRDILARSAARKRVSDILMGGEFYEDENFLPDRQDLVNLYTLVKAAVAGGGSLTDGYALYLVNTKLPLERRINYVKYKLMMKIFEQTEIFAIKQSEYVPDDAAENGELPQDISDIVPVVHREKVDIEACELMRLLRKNCKSR